MRINPTTMTANEVRRLQQQQVRDYWDTRNEERRWRIQSSKVHDLPSELAEIAFCEKCHADIDYSVEGEPRDYETNSGSYGYASECCGADVYAHRYRLDLSPGRVKYIYPTSALIEYDGAEDDYYLDEYQADRWNN